MHLLSKELWINRDENTMYLLKNTYLLDSGNTQDRWFLHTVGHNLSIRAEDAELHIKHGMYRLPNSHDANNPIFRDPYLTAPAAKPPSGRNCTSTYNVTMQYIFPDDPDQFIEERKYETGKAIRYHYDGKAFRCISLKVINALIANQDIILGDIKKLKTRKKKVKPPKKKGVQKGKKRGPYVKKDKKTKQ